MVLNPLPPAQCRDCCCNACNHGSSYCAFPRYNGEDIGDDTRNFIFFMCLAGFFNFALSYSIWANYGSPRFPASATRTPPRNLTVAPACCSVQESHART